MHALFSVSLIAIISMLLLGAAPAPATFTNPIAKTGADPQAAFDNGMYYYITCAPDNQLALYRTPDITAVAAAQHKIIWTPPANADHSKDVWAPELHKIAGKWYVYYAADDGNSDHHHMYVLENENKDPWEGQFKMKARLKTDPNDNWAIDGSVFDNKGELYIIWSGWPVKRVTTETACIYIARMKNPWTIGSERTMISMPELEWERHWKNPDAWKNTPGHEIYVNEGPAALQHGNKIFITYSASGCWTPFYCLGMLTADADKDLLDPATWTKSQKPVFQQSPEDHVFGTGHNNFFKSPDGTEDWIIYHANDNPNECGGALRSPRIQKITWNADGTPSFGKPIPITQAIPKPSGTK